MKTFPAFSGALLLLVAGSDAFSGDARVNFHAASPPTSAAPGPPARSGMHRAPLKAGYFVEFRARSGPLSGHSYVVTGYRSRGGKVRHLDSFGLSAAFGPVNYPMGLVLSRGTVSPGLLDGVMPDTIVYRVHLDRKRYLALKAYAERLRRSPPPFGLVINNCNSFTGLLARKIGLRTPRGTLRTPHDYIATLKRLNQ